MKETKLLVILVTTAAIAAAATATSLSAATPAFAAVNCNPDQTVCSGGGKAQTQGETCTGLTICHGGTGGRSTFSPDGGSTFTGGAGINGGDIVTGGIGGSFVCDEATGCTQIAGGSGQRP